MILVWWNTLHTAWLRYCYILHSLFLPTCNQGTLQNLVCHFKYCDNLEQLPPHTNTYSFVGNFWRLSGLRHWSTQWEQDLEQAINSLFWDGLGSIGLQSRSGYKNYWKIFGTAMGGITFCLLWCRFQLVQDFKFVHWHCTKSEWWEEGWWIWHMWLLLSESIHMMSISDFNHFTSFFLPIFLHDYLQAIEILMCVRRITVR